MNASDEIPEVSLLCFGETNECLMCSQAEEILGCYHRFPCLSCLWLLRLTNNRIFDDGFSAGSGVAVSLSAYHAALFRGEFYIICTLAFVVIYCTGIPGCLVYVSFGISISIQYCRSDVSYIHIVCSCGANEFRASIDCRTFETF